MTQQSVARTKIESAIAARGNEIDGIIATGYNPTVAAAGLLTERHKNPNLKQFHFIGIDTRPNHDPGNSGRRDRRNNSAESVRSRLYQLRIAETYARWYKPVKPYQLVDAGDVLVTKDNVDSYQQQVSAITRSIEEGSHD